MVSSLTRHLYRHRRVTPSSRANSLTSSQVLRRSTAIRWNFREYRFRFTLQPFPAKCAHPGCLISRVQSSERGFLCSLASLLPCCPSSTENHRQALMEPPLRQSLVNSGRGGTSVFCHRRLQQLRILRLGFLQVGIAAISAVRPTRPDRSWKRGLSRKPSMLGSI